MESASRSPSVHINFCILLLHKTLFFLFSCCTRVYLCIGSFGSLLTWRETTHLAMTKTWWCNIFSSSSFFFSQFIFFFIFKCSTCDLSLFKTVAKRRGGVSDCLPLLTETKFCVDNLLNVNDENIKTGLCVGREQKRIKIKQ